MATMRTRLRCMSFFAYLMDQLFPLNKIEILNFPMPNTLYICNNTLDILIHTINNIIRNTGVASWIVDRPFVVTKCDLMQKICVHLI